MVVQQNQKCGQRFVSGAADARSLAQVLTQLITFKDAINNSVEAPRVHLGSIPRSILLEGSLFSRFLQQKKNLLVSDQRHPQLSDLTVTALKGMKLQIDSEASCSADGLPGYFTYNSINIVSKIMDDLWSYADSRGNGVAVAF